MRRTIAIVLGFIISFIFLAVIGGGIYNAVQIIQLSLMCTLGISLIIWIPLWWFIGWLVIKIFESLTGITVGGENSSGSVLAIANQQRVSLTDDQISLINYIDKANRYGWSETQIYSRLRAQGWEDEEIQEAQSLVRERRGGN